MRRDELVVHRRGPRVSAPRNHEWAVPGERGYVDCRRGKSCGQPRWKTGRETLVCEACHLCWWDAPTDGCRPLRSRTDVGAAMVSGESPGRLVLGHETPVPATPETVVA